MNSPLSGVVDMDAMMSPRPSGGGDDETTGSTKIETIKNGGLKIFGDGAPDWPGIVCIDAYVPPLFRHSFYDNDDCLYYNVNRSNLLRISDHRIHNKKKRMATI